MSERCARCGKARVLQDFTTNQSTTIRICAACLEADSEKRSKAAKGRAGRKPVSPSQLEDQVYRIYLSSIDAKTFDMWLTTEGYTGTRGQMLKAHVMACIKAARRR